MRLKISIILGTARDGRQSEHVARYVLKRAQARQDIEASLVDPRQVALGDLRNRFWEMDDPPAAVVQYAQAMAAADGFVVVTPEYNHGIPGALKNLLDHLYEEWGGKPFALVGCGGISGGMRALEQLRLVVSGLGAVTIPRSVPVPHVKKAFGAQGPTGDEDAWARRVDKLLDELVAYAQALKTVRYDEAR